MASFRRTVAVFLAVFSVSALAQPVFFTRTLYTGSCAQDPTNITMRITNTVLCNECYSAPQQNYAFMLVCTAAATTVPLKIWYDGGESQCTAPVDPASTTLALGCVEANGYAQKTYFSNEMMFNVQNTSYGSHITTIIGAATDNPVIGGGSYVTGECFPDLMNAGKFQSYAPDVSNGRTTDRFLHLVNCGTCQPTYNDNTGAAGCDNTGLAMDLVGVVDQLFVTVSVNRTICEDPYLVELYNIPYQPIWVFFLKIGIGFVLTMIPGIIGWIIATAPCCECCRDSDSKVGKFLKKAFNLLLSMVRFATLVATYVLAILHITKLPFSGWHRYQCLVALLANSSVLSQAVVVTPFFKKAALKFELDEDDKEGSKVSCTLFFDVIRFVVPYVGFAPVIITHGIAGVFVFFPVFLALSIYYALIAGILKLAAGLTQKGTGPFRYTLATALAEAGISLAIFPLIIFANYIVFFFSGVGWIEVFALDYDLRRTDQYFNANYFEPYQTSLNYANLLIA